MPLDTYANLQAAILDWLARPGDPLLTPAVPDMITLFETEARQRLRVAGAETMTQIYPTGTADIPLPADFVELRSAALDGLGPLTAVAAAQADAMVVGGMPNGYTIYGGGDFACAGSGAFMRLSPPPSGSYTVNITYQRGLPALSTAAPSNWLLKQSPTAYLFGSLVEASAYIGHDERALAWLQRRDLAFESLERADRKFRWGGPLVMRPAMVCP